MKQKIIKPARLSPGDVIGIAAPAGPFEREIFEKGVTAIKDMGFEVMVPANLQQPDRFLAGSDARRASQLNNLFKDPDIKGIICARGGYGSMRILDRVDFGLLRRHPKIFIGFSDISALISAVVDKSGLVAFHGPLVTTLAMASPQTKTALYRALTSNMPLDIRFRSPRVVSPGTSDGIVSGGNLATLCHLLGTPYSPNYEGRIFVMEDIGEAPYRIDRMLYQMRWAGCFEGMSGLVIGRFRDCGDDEAVCGIAAGLFEDMRIPILGGVEIGHGDPNITIPMGLRATLDTDRGALVYHEAATIPSENPRAPATGLS